MVWICDSCKMPIQQPEDGWVQWINFGSKLSPRKRNLRLVHEFIANQRMGGEINCRFNEKTDTKLNESVGDDRLTDFLCLDGLIRLLEFFACNQLPKNEVLEMIKRLFMPSCEEAISNYYDWPIQLIEFLADDKISKKEFLEMIKTLEAFSGKKNVSEGAVDLISRPSNLNQSEISAVLKLIKK